MLRRLDRFGQKRGLSFNGSYTFKTICGFFLSLFTALMLIATFIFYGKKFIKRLDNPIIAVEKFNSKSAPSLNLNELNFFFTFSAIYENSYLTPEELVKILDIKVEQVSTRTTKEDTL
jgi:hypothetical protein